MEYVLIAVALLAGFVGAIWDKPPIEVKGALVILIFTSAGVSFIKVNQDDQDKAILQNLSIAGLALPNSAYVKIYELLENAFGPAPKARCHHTTEGLTCHDAFGSQPFVLNRYEVARIYADSLRGNDTRQYLIGIRNKVYIDLSDDYEDKLGVLGYHTFFDMCEVYPADYNYDDKFGVKIIYDDEKGARKFIQIFPKEMQDVLPGTEPALLSHFENIYRSRIQSALPKCTGDRPK